MRVDRIGRPILIGHWLRHRRVFHGRGGSLKTWLHDLVIGEKFTHVKNGPFGPEFYGCNRFDSENYEIVGDTDAPPDLDEHRWMNSL